jgi:hypothetical protein
MFPLNSNTLPVAAAILTALAAPTQACLHLAGKVGGDSSVSGDPNITTIDNGLQTCQGSIGKGDKDIGISSCLCCVVWSIVI